MLKYVKESFRRKKARRISQEYPHIIDIFNLPRDGRIEFANWENPLAPKIEINQSYVDFFRKFIKEGDFVIDIGANIGDTTVPMAIAAGKNGLTIGFDPNPFVYKILEINASLNKDITNISVFPFAISRQEEEFYYVSSEASFANGAISPVIDSKKHGKFVFPKKIKGIVLTDFLRRKYKDSLNKLSLIKIDTEGYDKEILKSIPEIINEYKPVIVVESFVNNTEEEKMELFQVLKDYNYTIYRFDDFTADTNYEEVKTKEMLASWKKKIDLFAIPEMNPK
jgi:FkbM family methyltransferase